MGDRRRVVKQIEGYVVDVDIPQIQITVREKGSERDYCPMLVNGELAQAITEQGLDTLGAPFLLTTYSDGSYRVRLDKSRDKPAKIDKETSELLRRLESQDEQLIRELRN